jgi:hypothetical protein
MKQIFRTVQAIIPITAVGSCNVVVDLFFKVLKSINNSEQCHRIVRAVYNNLVKIFCNARPFCNSVKQQYNDLIIYHNGMMLHHNGVNPYHNGVKPYHNSVKPYHNGVKLYYNGVKPYHNGVKPYYNGVKPHHNGMKTGYNMAINRLSVSYEKILFQ